MNLRVQHAGFTLIEVMTVVIIVAFLLIVGLPAYQNQIIRGHRAAAKAEMLEIANREHQFLLSNRTYTNNPDDLSYELPDEVVDYYDFELSTLSASSVPAFTLTFSPVATSLVKDDGDLTLNSEGEKTPADKWER